MSDFSIFPEQLAAQRNNINSVSDALQQCRKIVDDVNSGLQGIGIKGVGPALFTITSKLTKYHKECESFSDALSRIVRRFRRAESTIAGTRTISQILEELIEAAEEAFTPIEESPYVGAIYLVNDEGAFWQGHAAVVLLRADGSYEYYSYGSDLGIGYLPDNLFDFDGSSQSGDMDIDPTGDRYSDYVFIPITVAQGDALHEVAQGIYQNPGDYELFGNNCNMNAQAILEAGGVSFAPTEFDMIATRPNTVYQNFMDLVTANREAYAGYEFGHIPNGDLVSWLESSTGAQQYVSGDYDYTVAHVDNVQFHDPSGWLANGLETIFGGTSMEEISSYWREGWSNGFMDGMDFTIDHIQNIGNTAINSAQSASTSAIDWVQENYITGTVGGVVNPVIDGVQAVGNTVIDGAQWVGDTVVDGAQWIGNTIVDGAEYIGDAWVSFWG